MNRERYRRIKNIVMQALELPADQLEVFLQESCDGDAVLRREVDELLKLNISDSFLAQSPVEAEFSDADSNDLKGEIGRIKIDQLLARGGMGEVYAGMDKLLERPVAIKVMTAGLRMSAKRRSAFLNEARVLSSLQHPNICQVYDFFEDQDKDVLVMELIEGVTLREALDQGNIKEPLTIARQIAAALAAAHERGIVHRDLKPENVMLTVNGQAKVLDFGLARAEAESVDSNIGLTDAQPARTQMAGTPGYMAPEQARSEPSSSASDLWSFGMLLSELLTGKRLFSVSASSIELIEQARQGDIQLPDNLPREEAALLRQLLTAKPEDRLTARATLQALDHIIDRPRRRLRAGIVTALLLVAVVVGWKYTSDLRHEQQLAIQERERAELARSEAEDLVGFMLDELNTGLQSVGRLDLMESVAEQALAYYGELDMQRMQATQGQPALALLRIAGVLDFQGDREQSLQVATHATTAFSELSKTLPDDLLVRYRTGLAHMQLADLQRTQGNFPEAIQAAETSIELGRRLTAGFAPGEGPDEQPTGAERWKILLRSMYLKADAHMRIGAETETVLLLEAAADLAEPAVQIEPKLATDLGDIQFKRCDAYHDFNRRELLLEACQAAMEIDGQLYAADSDNHWLYKNYSLDHMVLGRVYLSLDRPQEGLAIISKGEQHARAIAAWDPSNAESQNDLAAMLNTKGRILQALDQQAESRQTFEAALAISEPLAADREGIPFMNNVFVSLIHLGRIEEAVDMAKTLRDRGFKRREFIELCEQFELTECTP